MNSITIKSTDDDVGRLISGFQRDVVEPFFPTREKRDSLEYIIMELVNNAFEHGNKRVESKNIVLDWKYESKALVFSVEDEGEGFDCTIPKGPPPITDTRGRGLWSIALEATEITFNEKGNKVIIKVNKSEEEAVDMKDEDCCFFIGNVVVLRSDAQDIHSKNKSILNKIADLDEQKVFEVDPTFLIIDITGINNLNSMLLGAVGTHSNGQNNSKVAKVALCGASDAVQKRLKQFGLAEPGSKVQIFKNIAEAVNTYIIQV